MSAKDVGLKLVEFCRQGKMLEAIDSLYSKDIVSVEPMAMPPMPAETRGFDAVRGKSVWWMDNHEMHSAKVDGPFVAGDRFAVYFNFDVTEKNTKKRMQMTEIGVYQVAGGKVVREDFMYLEGK